MVMKNNINPSYYKNKSIEVIDCIESIIEDKPSKEAFLVGQVIKYVARYNKKNGIEDLNKATWYLERLTRIVNSNEPKQEVKILEKGQVLVHVSEDVVNGYND